ncbi:hypothetical protein RND71_007996 [Anisodus tanguticus]|uniref:Uncharacterized protein n=1 Tax=Anisodus tanguticus TaxID=243964 RepID=A0AAE1SML8_9SOLA|nr:hypothetical protein RND71_007996 [Anisodus tanguticus]
MSEHQPDQKLNPKVTSEQSQAFIVGIALPPLGRFSVFSQSMQSESVPMEPPKGLSSNRMIHKKGGRIRTYGRPAPDLLGDASLSFLSRAEKTSRCEAINNSRYAGKALSDRLKYNSHDEGFGNK